MADKPLMHHYIEMELSMLGLIARLAATASLFGPFALISRKDTAAARSAC